jgi:hypothetical protein
MKFEEMNPAPPVTSTRLATTRRLIEGCFAVGRFEPFVFDVRRDVGRSGVKFIYVPRTLR